jgi:hypothetical protein
MKKSLRCIGVCGQKQQGKDTLADYLAPKLSRNLVVPCHGGVRYEAAPWGRGSFAGAVKRIFCETFNKDLDFIEYWKTRDDIPPGMAMPVRQALTFIGDGFRKIQPDIWIVTAFRPEYEPYDKVYSDIRYINEARKIRDEGGINVLIYRDDPVKGINWDSNGSESEIRPYVMWCVATGKEGRISEWPEFQSRKLNLNGGYGHEGSSQIKFDDFWLSLPKDWTHAGGAQLEEKFFEALSQFDIFVRSPNGVENVYRKVDEMVLPYIQDHYLLSEGAA